MTFRVRITVRFPWSIGVPIRVPIRVPIPIAIRVPIPVAIRVPILIAIRVPIPVTVRIRRRGRRRILLCIRGCVGVPLVLRATHQKTQTPHPNNQ